MTLYAAFVDWKQGVADWIDTTSGPTFENTGTFIRLAEIELDKRLRLRESSRFVSNTIDNDGILTMPDDYAQIKQINVGERSIPLEVMTPDQFQTQWSRSAGRDGQPCYYTIIGNNLQFWPKGAGLNVQLAYYRKAVPLSDQVPENIYTKYAPECLLNGAVMYGFKFSNDEERTIIWKDKFDELVVAANMDTQRGELGSSPIRMRTRDYLPRHRTRGF